MAGIYIHIPFCRKACHYCNFHFSTSLKQTGEMMQAIRQEASMRHTYINEKVDTIYFGGGTPSLIPVDEISCTLDHLRSMLKTDDAAEITLEANPDDITPVSLEGWKTAGINRLSIGIQSFHGEDLRWMNRAHHEGQGLQSLRWAREAGFGNISIDLIYGTPGLTDEQWKHNVAAALSLEIPHLSCYALTVEPRTALDVMIRKGTKEDIDPEKQSRHFELLMQWMNDAGYEHYEISNFAKPGYRSRHNSSYWQGRSYLGLGPAAHSFNGRSRQWNIANNALYVKGILAGSVPFEEEHLTADQRLNEYVMTSLRTKEGLSLSTVKAVWDDRAATRLFALSKKYIGREWMVEKDGSLVLTMKGRLFADGIAADLFTGV